MFRSRIALRYSSLYMRLTWVTCVIGDLSIIPIDVHSSNHFMPINRKLFNLLTYTAGDTSCVSLWSTCLLIYSTLRRRDVVSRDLDLGFCHGCPVRPPASFIIPSTARFPVFDCNQYILKKVV